MKGRISLCATLLTACSVLAAVCAVLAFPESVPAGKGGKGGGQDERISLCVEFDDGEFDRIKSGLPFDEYCDGDVDTVDPDSWISAYSLGGFALDTAGGAKADPSRGSKLVVGGRMVFFDFTLPADAATGATPFATGEAEVLMYLVLKTFPDGVDLRTMAPGDSFFSDMVMRISPNWRITFGRPPGGGVEATDSVCVTAGHDLYGDDGFADEWRIETVETWDVGRLWKTTDTRTWSEQGKYHLPFGLTARAVP